MSAGTTCRRREFPTHGAAGGRRFPLGAARPPFTTE
jgi:hypothetical protein